MVLYRHEFVLPLDLGAMLLSIKGIAREEKIYSPGWYSYPKYYGLRDLRAAFKLT